MSLEKFEELLKSNENLYNHSAGVAREMKILTDRLFLSKSDQEDLMIAAYLHEIGSLPGLFKKGYVPLDSAIYCKQNGLCAEIQFAIMFCSGSYNDVRSNFPDLISEYHKAYYERTKKGFEYMELLSYCDLLCSKDGQKITLEEKIAEIYTYYGNDNNRSLTFNSNKFEFKKLIRKVEKKVKA